MINNEVTSFPIDEKFQRAMEFAKNKKDLNNSAGLSNLYVIQKVDMDGNLIDEYYGENLMTDYGMSQFFISNGTFPSNMYIGNGTGSFGVATNELLSTITTTASTSVSTKISYDYPLYYDKISGLITCVAKYLECYFDYNISGVTSDVSITEYGLGTAYNALWTHSWVYDITGSQTTITKNLNERLNITVYLCMSYYETLITNNYANGIYTVITSMRRFFENKMYEASVGTFKRDTTTTRTKTNTSSGLMNNQIVRNTNMGMINIYNDNTVDGDYVDGFYQYTQGFITFERQLIPVAEPVDMIASLNNLESTTCLSDSMGRVGYIPFTQLALTSMSLFNFKTGKWDNTENVVGDSNVWYNELPMSTTMGNPIYYTNNNTVQLMYVHVNIKTDDPITSLTNVHLETVYVTDKYWDVTSWVLLNDPSNIPAELQTKRYWITTTNAISLEPVRALTKLKLIQTKGDVIPYAKNPYNSYEFTYGNYDYDWYIRSSTLYSQTHGTSYTIPASGSNRVYYSYDKWLITIGTLSNGNFTIADTSDLSITPTFETISPAYNTSFVANTTYNNCTGTGIFCLQDIISVAGNRKTAILNLQSGSPVLKMITTDMSCCIANTSKIAYISGSSLIIEDESTSSIVNTITLPTDIDINIIVGHSNYVWISNGIDRTYVINITSGVATLCKSPILINNVRYTHISFVDDVILISSTNTGGKANVIDVISDPTQIKYLTDFEKEANSTTTWYDYDITYVHGNTLAVILRMRSSSGNRAINVIGDLGRFLKMDEVVYYTNSPNGTSFVPFGEFVLDHQNRRVPIENYLQHRIIGTTNTITSINAIKQITNKQWMQTITNIPQFNGLPPGKKQ